MSKILISLFCLFFTATATNGEPARYGLVPDKTTVGFTYKLDGNPIKGTMPVVRAEMIIDFDALPASNVQISLDASKARGGFVFATQALRGKSVLDTAQHPLVQFVSNDIVRTSKGAVVKGNITIRGVTRSVTLKASFFRHQNSKPQDLSNLMVLLTGSVSRAAFGAEGYPKLVGDQIDLHIVANIKRL